MIGKTISQYKIKETLGKGGMGEVYLAEDTRLGRNVALKFLPRHLTTDNAARERFEREARAAAALSHKNIVTIHEINEHDEQVFIAMEYVEGSTLRERMTRSGGFRLEETVEIISQVCDGLQKAHQAGIVHRDLKPENIMIDRDGGVKILDFGLAKLRGVTKLTKESSTLGTIHYKSPEQTRGEEVDARADVWSLGVLLYEMLADQRPFAGDFEQAVVYSILNEEPAALRDVRPGVPPALENIVSKALRKRPIERYQDVSALQAALAESFRVAESPKRQKSNRVLPVISVIIGLCAVVLAVSYYLEKTKTTTHIPAQYQQVTFTGNCGSASISPDGNYLAYSSGEGNERGIFIKDLRGGSAVNVFTGPRCWVGPWSPDGSRVLFAAFLNDSTMGTYIIPRMGGAARRILPVPWGFFTWSGKSDRIAYTIPGQSSVNTIDLETGEIESFELGPDVGEVYSLDWSWARDEFLIQAEETERQVLWAFETDGSDKRIIMENRDMNAPIGFSIWASDGDAIYYLEMALRGQAVYDLKKVSVDDDTGVAKGEPRVLLNSLQMSDSDLYSISIARDSERLLYVRENEYSNLWLVEISGDGTDRITSNTQLTSTTTWKSSAKISPDGKTVVFAMSEGNAANIYTMPLEFEKSDTPPVPKQLTFFNSLNDMPVWSPDGEEIAFVSSQGGTPGLWRMGKGGESPRRIENSGLEYMWGDYVTWAPGPDIIYRSTGIRGFTVLDPRTGEQRSLVEDEEVGYIFYPCWSPDGKNVALFWNQLTDNVVSSMKLWVLSVEDGTRRVFSDGRYYPIEWSSDSDWVFASGYGESMTNKTFRIPVHGGEPELYVELPLELQGPEELSITPDGRKIVYAEVTASADVWIVENFDPEVE